ncbi:uncharacterized protein ACJ7VT_005230 [Polymixia lowei]
MESRVNRRGFTESFVKAKHLKLADLKEKAKDTGNQYIFKENIPLYPRPEFHVSHLRHDTDLDGVFGIHMDLAFRTREDTEEAGSLDSELMWWSLSVGPEEMESAEERLLEETYPDRTEEQAREQRSFLHRFATSPAFLETSRLGSFRFTFPLQDLLELYRQGYGGGEPILRVFETVLYKQEVMYTVLVHSHFYNTLFKDYPLLTDSPDGVCAYKDGHFIWRPEAMCETHSFELIKKPNQNQFAAHLISESKRQYYVWDHVAIAFHMPDCQRLNFSNMYKLREHLRFCEPGNPTISPPETFSSFEDANEMVETLWPYYHTPFY